jgi:hypothetical protein
LTCRLLAHSTPTIPTLSRYAAGPMRGQADRTHPHQNWSVLPGEVLRKVMRYQRGHGEVDAAQHRETT